MLRPFIPALIFMFLAPAMANAQGPAEMMKQADEYAAAGEHIKALDMLKEAYIKQWLKTPLMVRNATFVSQPNGGYGKYTPRADAVFKSGEEMLIYAEPIGYGWAKTDDGYSIDFVVDFTVSSADGKILGGRKAFQNMGLKSKVRNTEFFISLNYTFSGIPPGEYFVSTTLNDRHSAKSVSFDLPFTIK